VGRDGEEAKGSGKRRKEALAPRRSGVGDKTSGTAGGGHQSHMVTTVSVRMVSCAAA
jgi:hypothetical protein